MAKQNINTLKNWFMRSLKPRQQQFWDWMDSYWHKDDKIPVASVDGLTEFLNGLPSSESVAALAAYISGETITFNAPGTYNIPANRILEKIRVRPVQDTPLRIGSANGLGDYLPETPDYPFLADSYQMVTLDIPAKTDKTIYISGFTGSVTITFYTR